MPEEELGHRLSEGFNELLNKAANQQGSVERRSADLFMKVVPRFKAASSPSESFLIGIHKEKSGRYLDPPLSCHTPTGTVCNPERCTVHRF